MRKFNKAEGIFGLEEVYPYRFYAGKFHDHDNGFLFHATSYLSPKTVVMSETNFTKGNTHDTYPTLRDAIEAMSKVADIYEFDTFKEMCQWLADNS